MRGLSPLPHLSVKLEHRVRRGNRPSLRCRTAACRRPRASWPASRRPANASRRSACAGSPRSPAPRPRARCAGRCSRAAITLLSLTTRQSPARSRSGRSPMLRSSSAGVSPGRTTSSRAASRGLAGRKAMRSGRQIEIEQVGSHVYSSCPGRSAACRTPSPDSTALRVMDSRLAMPGTSPAMTQLRRFSDPSRPHRRLDDLVGILDRLAALDLVDVVHALDRPCPTPCTGCRGTGRRRSR